MKKVFTINSKLEKAGIKTARVIQSVDDCEDDMIEVNDSVHVQVGDGYLAMYIKRNEESYCVYSATSKNIVEKVKWALATDPNSL
jgi:hypothetical protein